MQIAPGNPGSPAANSLIECAPKLLAIKVSGGHPIPVICEPVAVAAGQGWAATTSTM
jgi:hypothetical protein